jgi:shikimate kinase
MSDTSIATISKKNLIFLIGLMGCGKTFLANILSNEKGIDCIDLDKLIEKEEQSSVTDIFKNKGELVFRDLETKFLKECITSIRSLIVATGGGTPCFNDNIQLMNEKGITIWLDESIETIIERIKPCKFKRPLIADIDEENLTDYFEALHKARNPFYSQCQYKLIGKQITKENLSKIINQYV